MQSGCGDNEMRFISIFSDLSATQLCIQVSLHTRHVGLPVAVQAHATIYSAVTLILQTSQHSLQPLYNVIYLCKHPYPSS